MAAAAAGGGIGTVSVHGGSDPDQWKCKAMWPPIISSTTYKQSVIESRLVGRPTPLLLSINLLAYIPIGGTRVNIRSIHLQ